MKLLTSRKERLIRMEYAPRPVSDKVVISFPIVVTIIISLLAPDAAPSVSYTHLRAHETVLDLVCRLLLEKKKYTKKKTQ